jgi:hypothetical protein
LRGVAAFNWDGTAWQPAGRAGPDVATPYGVLQGVAMFNWTGSAWAAVGAPSLSLDFMTPGTLDPRIAFTRASTATYTDSTGTIQTAATNAPRWDYDPVTHALKGLLIEEARTNIMPGSIPIGGPWGPSAVTVTAASGIAPDSTNTMVRMAETTANALHNTSVGMGFPGGGNWTGSIYAKAAEVRYLQLSLDDGGSNGVWATFDLIGGAVTGPLASRGTAVGISASMQPVGNGVWRCVITFTPAGAALRTMLITSNVASPGQWPSYAGNASNGLLIWGVDIEQGAFPTSYIPTTAAAVTRAQDNCGVSSANMSPWFVSPGGSWFAEFISIVPTPSNARIIGQPTSGGITPLFLAPGSLLSQYDSSGAINAVAPTATANAVHKGASTYAAGTGRVCLDAGAIGSGAMTVGYGALSSFGVNFLTPEPSPTPDNLSGYIRRVVYWPRVLTNAEMQQVTT